MRREPTPAEQRLWFALRAGRLGGLKVRRQKVVGPYIVDFAAREPMLVVEVDGHTHHDAAADEARSRYLRQAGYDVIRFTNEEVLRNLDGVLEALAIRIRWLRSHPSPLQGRGGSREAAEGEGDARRTSDPLPSRSPLPSAPDGAPSLSPEGERA